MSESHYADQAKESTALILMVCDFCCVLSLGPGCSDIGVGSTAEAFVSLCLSAWEAKSRCRQVKQTTLIISLNSTLSQLILNSTLSQLS